MTLTVLYPERMYPDQSVEDRIFGSGVEVLIRPCEKLADLDSNDCIRTYGLMTFHHSVRTADLAGFPRLKALVRMGVGYDKIDCKEAAARGVLVCNVPD
ncbi:MAG: hypothetical protein ACREFO_13240 [Acetobacteraceae bacterium]